MFFSTIYEQYGIMVQMVIEVIVKIRYFLFFILYWCTFFSWLFKVAHIDVKSDDYPGVHPFIFYFLQIARNSVGDLAPIEYSKWLDYSDEEAKTLTSMSGFMMSVCWFIWGINVIFMLIILMNLFISIVSVAFEEVMSISNVIRYKQRTQFIYEATMISELFRGKQHAKSYILQAQIESESLEKELGIVKPLKTFVYQEVKKVRMDVDTLRQQMNDSLICIKTQMGNMETILKYLQKGAERAEKDAKAMAASNVAGNVVGKAAGKDDDSIDYDEDDPFK